MYRDCGREIMQTVDKTETASEQDQPIAEVWMGNTIDDTLVGNSPLDKSRTKRSRKAIGTISLVIIQVIRNKLLSLNVLGVDGVQFVDGAYARPRLLLDGRCGCIVDKRHGVHPGGIHPHVQRRNI